MAGVPDQSPRPGGQQRLLGTAITSLGLAATYGLVPVQAFAEQPAVSRSARPDSCIELEGRLEEVSRRKERLEWRFRKAEVASTELEKLMAERDELKRRWSRECAPVVGGGPAPEWRSCLELFERRSELAGRQSQLGKRARAAGKRFDVIDHLRDEVAALDQEWQRRRCPKDSRGS